MTQMGLEYQKYKESQRHNIATEDISSRDVATKEFTTSFEPHRVKATVAQAQAAVMNAETNKYTASFEPRKVAATEKQAKASMKQANVQESKFSLDASWRDFEEQLRAQENDIKKAKNEIDKFIVQFNALPAATKAGLATAGLNLNSAGQAMAGLETGMDKGMSYFNTLMNGIKPFISKATGK